MNKFIVWDIKKNIFVDYESINEFARPPLSGNNIFEHIGLKDIEENKIYADCSIVEFTNYANKKQYQGYFKYDFYHQRMFIWFLHCVRDNKAFGYLGDGLDRVEYQPRIMVDFKIIDTIQENKLGLIG